MEWSADRIIAVIGIGAGVVLAVIAIGVGLGMDTKTQGEFRFVQCCFVFSGLALFIPVVLWGIKSQAYWGVRTGLSAVLAALIAVSLIQGLRWATGRFDGGKFISISPTPIPPSAPLDADDLAQKLAERLREESPKPRAHLHVTKFEWTIPQDEGEQASVKIIFVNDGNAPTTKVVHASAMAYFTPVGDMTAQRDFESLILSRKPTDTKEKLGAFDNQIPVGVDRSFTTKSSPWKKNAIDNFLLGNAVAYVAGSIFYSDTHASYETSYCGFMDKDGYMKFCGKHNKED